MIGRSDTPSPPRGRGSPSPRGRGVGWDDRAYPTGLLVRNLRHDCSPEDLRLPFGQFGPLRDVYLPRNYNTGKPRGFGFVKFVDPADAANAKYQMDGQILLGREITVIFADDNRKKPADMRARYGARSRSYGRRSSPRSPPRRSEQVRSRSRSRGYSRSISPHGSRLSREGSHSIHQREKSHSKSPARSTTPVGGRVDISGAEKDASESGRERSPTHSG